MINNETICAIATAVGGAIAIVRVSGTDAINNVQKILDTDIKSRGMYHGHVVSNDEVVDEVMVLVYCAPHSYTCEDSVEICCHGSKYILQRVMTLLINNGCRQAKPGEFTERAFLNGRLDLSQAEAVADLIASTNRATHDIAMSQLRGGFSSELSSLRDQLLKLTSLLELELDFSEEDVTFANRSQLLDIARKIRLNVINLINSFRIGQALKDGVAVAIIGKTNVGKSTLLNALLHEDRAIVSDIHGTTRDVIEDTTQIDNVTFRFVDTAGLRSTADEVEKLGIERTYKELSKAMIVIWLIDNQPTQEETLRMKNLTEGKKLIIVRNKIDLNKETSDDESTALDISVSAKYGTNLDLLKHALLQAADIPEIHENDVIVTNVRHYECLQRAEEGINHVIDGLNANLSADFLSEDLRFVLRALGDITGGAITSQETLNNIFSHFCIGK
jgi:tRNA modification GTPase